MIRTQISLSESQMRAAKAAARSRGVSLAELIRQALDELLAKSPDEAVRERARSSVGGFHSGVSDTSEEHDEALAGRERW